MLELRDTFEADTLDVESKQLSRFGSQMSSASAAKAMFLNTRELLGRDSFRHTVGRVLNQADEGSVYEIAIQTSSMDQRNEAGIQVLAQLISSEGSRSAATLWECFRDVVPEDTLRDILLLHLRRSAQHGFHRSEVPESFVTSAQRLAARGNTSAALDLIYDKIDSLILQQRFRELDGILAGIHVEEMSTSLLLGFLTATLPARDKLASRKPLLKSVEAVARARGEWERDLLIGL